MRDFNHIPLLTGVNLVTGGALNSFGDNFPLGRGWYKTRIRIGINLTVGTGVGAITEGELLFIKNINFKTDKNEVLCNMSGRALYRMLHKEAQTLARKDAIAASNGTYYVYLTIPHVNKKSKRPLDTILDTARYKKLTMQVTVGGVADLLTTPGTATVTATIDSEAISSATILPAIAQPLMYRTWNQQNPVNPTTQTYIDLDRAPDLAISNLLISTSNNGVGGVGFTGANADTVINTYDVKDQDKYYIQARIWEFAQSDNKENEHLETIDVGGLFHDFMEDGSILSSVYTGNKSQFRVQWVNKGSVANTDQVSLAYDGVRALVA